MSAGAIKFLTVSRRGLACLWAATGSWPLFARLHNHGSLALPDVIPLTIALAFIIGGSGLFFNYRWGRISIGCLMAVPMLVSADMLLFIAYRGLSSGRGWLLVVVLTYIAASISTWLVLATTFKRCIRRAAAGRCGFPR